MLAYIVKFVIYEHENSLPRLCNVQHNNTHHAHPVLIASC